MKHEKRKEKEKKEKRTPLLKRLIMSFIGAFMGKTFASTSVGSFIGKLLWTAVLGLAARLVFNFWHILSVFLLVILGIALASAFLSVIVMRGASESMLFKSISNIEIDSSDREIYNGCAISASTSLAIAAGTLFVLLLPHVSVDAKFESRGQVLFWACILLGVALCVGGIAIRRRARNRNARVHRAPVFAQWTGLLLLIFTLISHSTAIWPFSGYH
jgi:hypothetical protein